MEIINGIERRRRWWIEEKIRILMESQQPGVTVADVARRRDGSRGLDLAPTVAARSALHSGE